MENDYIITETLLIYFIMIRNNIIKYNKIYIIYISLINFAIYIVKVKD